MKNKPSQQEFVADVRAGLIDTELMEKYDLSVKELREIFVHLLDAATLTLSETYCRPLFWDDSLEVEVRRQFPRLLMAFMLPVYEVDRPQVRGVVVDVNDKGMRIRGVDAQPGEVKTLVVDPRRYADLETITFEAECRWVSQEPDGRPVEGFRITHISEADRRALRDFIRFVTTGQKKKRPVMPVERSSDDPENGSGDRLSAPHEPCRRNLKEALIKPLKVSFSVTGSESLQTSANTALARLLRSLDDLAVTTEDLSEYHLAIAIVPEDSGRFIVSTVVSKSVWAELECLIRQGLLAMWEVMTEKSQEDLARRGAVMREIMGRLKPDRSLKALHHSEAATISPDVLEQACERIVSDFERRFLVPRRPK